MKHKTLGFKRTTEHQTTPRKKIKIQSASDGSASLVISSEPKYHPSSSTSLITPTTTTLTQSSPISRTISSKNHSIPLLPIYHSSSLVSADIQDYGRVAIKKEALIDKLGYEAAQRAIHKARKSTHQRPKSYYYPKRPQLPPSPQSASSRTNRIKKWLESADRDEDEDYSPALNSQSKPTPLLDTLTRLAELGPGKVAPKKKTMTGSDPQSLFWSPTTTTNQTPKLFKEFNTEDDSSSSNSKTLTTRKIIAHRDTTPPNQQNFFRCENLETFIIKPPNDLFAGGSYSSSQSQISFSQPQPQPLSLNTMLKPGCNLNHSFLSLAPSPTIILSSSASPSAEPSTDLQQSLLLFNYENKTHPFLPESPSPPPSSTSTRKNNDTSMNHDENFTLNYHHFFKKSVSPPHSKKRINYNHHDSSSNSWLCELDINQNSFNSSILSSSSPDPPCRINPTSNSNLNLNCFSSFIDDHSNLFLNDFFV